MKVGFVYIIAGCLALFGFLLIYFSYPETPILPVIIICIIIGLISILFGIGSELNMLN